MLFFRIETFQILINFMNLKVLNQKISLNFVFLNFKKKLDLNFELSRLSNDFD